MMMPPVASRGFMKGSEIRAQGQAGILAQSKRQS